MKISFMANASQLAQKTFAGLSKLYNNCDPEECDVIVPLGGDGFMLEVAHKYLSLNKPFYGINCGAVGFMMNHASHADETLIERIKMSVETIINPISMKVESHDGTIVNALAINEISLLRASPQAAQIKIFVDGAERLEQLICDGILVATPAGSTAYNLSAHGPIIPLGTPLLALTPITPFRPRRWRGALLNENASVRFEVLDTEKRPVSVAADGRAVCDAISVEVKTYPQVEIKLLFDDDHSLGERILREQFTN